MALEDLSGYPQAPRAWEFLCWTFIEPSQKGRFCADGAILQARGQQLTSPLSPLSLSLSLSLPPSKSACCTRRCWLRSQGHPGAQGQVHAMPMHQAAPHQAPYQMGPPHAHAMAPAPHQGQQYMGCHQGPCGPGGPCIQMNQMPHGMGGMGPQVSFQASSGRAPAPGPQHVREERAWTPQTPPLRVQTKTEAAGALRARVRRRASSPSFKLGQAQ